jgi:N-acetylmuramoyl-L-alanine amidase
MRLTIPTVLFLTAALLTGCGSGNKQASAVASTQPTDPKAVPTATLPSVLPSPIPAGTVTEGGITGQANSGPTTYTVKSGDTMAAIANTVGVPLALLQSYNSDVDPSRLIVGQVIKVPPPPSSTAPSTVAPLRPSNSTPASASSASRSATPTIGGASSASRTASPAARATSSSTPSTASGGGQTYVVQSGDTACDIAAKFGVSLQDLATANGSTPATVGNLKVGQDLKIPPSTGASRGC